MNKHKKFKILLIGLFFLLVIFRIHNVLNYNPYWGYDGGAHIDYISKIAKENTIPSINDNYIAWHEPLYYLIQGNLLKLFINYKYFLKILGLIQVLISLLVTIIIYKITKLISKDKTVLLLSNIVLNILPPLSLTSTILSNEILNYFFIFLALYIYLKHFLQPQKSGLKYLFLGIVLGFGLIAKVTILILLIIILLMILIDIWKTKSKKIILGFLILLTTIITINIPWYIYRTKNILNSFSINNYNFLQPQKLKLDSRLQFYKQFNFDIFKFPYWYSGGNSFWSMIYADTFSDYYVVMENKDLLYYLQNHNLDKLIKLNNNYYIIKKEYYYSLWALRLSITLFIILIFGIIKLVKDSRNKNKKALLGILITSSFAVASIYYSYRYPYPESGTVKSMFVFPVLLFPVVFGFSFAKELFNKYSYKHYRILFYIFFSILFSYLLLILKIFWIIHFNY